VARAPWAHSKCARQGEWQRDSPSKQGCDEATEMSSGGSVSGDGVVLWWSLAAEEGS
jgi:hypothetical protein